MLYQLKRHPLTIDAHLEHVLVLTYALPAAALAPQLPPGLTLETWRGRGMMAIATVSARHLRPRGMPAWTGRDFFLSGYRIFAMHRDAAGRTRRGLRIVRSHTDRPLMACAGNLLTHYNYRCVNLALTVNEQSLDIDVRTPAGDADLAVHADLQQPGALPHETLFDDEHQARRFAGPLPYTFDYEKQTHSIIMIKGERSNWHPRLVNVDVRRNTFFDGPLFGGAAPILCSAFYLTDAPYRWRRGVRHLLDVEQEPSRAYAASL